MLVVLTFFESWNTRNPEMFIVLECSESWNVNNAGMLGDLE